MKLLNLNSMRVKDYSNLHNITTEKEITWGEDVSIHELEEQLKAVMRDLALEDKTLYTFNFTCGEISAFAFEQLVDIATMVFSDCIKTPQKREREYRLGIDPALNDNCHLIPWILKNWINFKTSINIFNIRITCGEWCWEMVK